MAASSVLALPQPQGGSLDKVPLFLFLIGGLGGMLPSIGGLMPSAGGMMSSLGNIGGMMPFFGAMPGLGGIGGFGGNGSELFHWICSRCVERINTNAQGHSKSTKEGWKKEIGFLKQEFRYLHFVSKDDATDKTSVHLKKDNYLVIIIWLKIEQNYNSCFGTGKALAVGRPAKVKINGFEMMAINLQNQSPSKINLTPCQMND
ncbi:uncharacterized protein VP01_1117g3 [Puccinia sorghi]|uniref:Uncharacterized protein n=1 Tax=Puccinia sorghi TaxID=27349 RepID=A0A0L6VSG2_9BASI|nr:uncharacterized protein VP01_1117g3 [Puccinia sorghi]